MSEAKHTPGPWRVSGHRLAVFAKLNGINVVVADCDRTLGYSESEANARLIAAAPELLAALQEVTMVLDRIFGVEGREPDAESISGRARAAIAKATAQQ